MCIRDRLYTIDKSRNESAPVQVTIKPLTAPVNLIMESLKVNSTFGGIYMTWENPMRQAIAISIYRKNAEGEMALYDTYYSDAPSGRASFRCV